jgi:hypothetical protein
MVVSPFYGGGGRHTAHVLCVAILLGHLAARIAMKVIAVAKDTLTVVLFFM